MSHSIIILLVSSDVCGRFDTDALPPQAKMELLVANFEDNRILHNNSGEFTDIEEWPGLRFTESGDITSIEWSFSDFGAPEAPGGSIDFSFLPSTLETLYLILFGLRGTLTTAFLPETLTDFDISNNRIAGTCDATNLPPSLVNLEIHDNDFEGNFRLDALPKTLELVDISRNHFSGTLDFTLLIVPIVSFFAETNNFSGSLDFSHLPGSRMRIWLYENTFKQDTLIVDPDCFEAHGLQVDDGVFGEIRGVNGKPISIRRVKNILKVSAKDE